MTGADFRRAASDIKEMNSRASREAASGETHHEVTESTACPERATRAEGK